VQSWTPELSPVSKSLEGIVFANDLYVVVGKDGVVLTSPDGMTYTARRSGTDQDLVSVTHGQGIFLAVGSKEGANAKIRAVIRSSADGIDWVTVSPPSTGE
jgi:hypothetical protein